MTKPYHLLFDLVLSRTDPEKAHHAAFAAIRAARPVTSRTLAKWHPWPPEVAEMAPRGGSGVRAMGLDFPNVLGLAAGFDKNAVGIDALAALGFGHVEIGTVTGLPQPGNPQPRLFRLPDDRAVVNRMGFNNDGAEVVAERLAARARRRERPRVPRRWAMSATSGGHECHLGGTVLGVNIGRSKVVPEDDEGAVIADYAKSTTCLAPYADYLVVNVSSPNTPGLRSLQSVEKLEPLLRAVRRTADEVVSDRRVPLLVKIAPDLSDEDVLAVADLARAIDLDGVIATNTTISRDGLASDPQEVEAIGAGGISGAPLAARALEVMRMLRDHVGPELTLIGVGGITTVEDALARLEAGADLLQGYTAFIYEGPLWPSRITQGVARGR